MQEEGDKPGVAPVLSGGEGRAQGHRQHDRRAQILPTWETKFLVQPAPLFQPAAAFPALYARLCAPGVRVEGFPGTAFQASSTLRRPRSLPRTLEGADAGVER